MSADHTFDVDRLQSVRMLRRSDGRGWREALEPRVRDSVGIEPDTELPLLQIERAVDLLLAELALHPLPQFVAYTAPGDPQPVTPISFASSLVAHRAERLVQAAELASVALDSLETGRLQISGISARALFEMAILCADVHQPMLEPWRSVHGNIKRVRAEAHLQDGVTFQLLWQTRMGSRLLAEAEDGWPRAAGVTNKIKRFSRIVTSAQETYDMLCEVTHPNVEAHASLWRTEYRTVGQLRTIRFAPGNSNSTIKHAIVDAVFMSLGLIIPFVRDLWWVAADIANVCDMTPNAHTRAMGIPARTGRYEMCSCGSGVITRHCDHPEPEWNPEIELGE